MNITPNDFVTHKQLDDLLTELMDYIKTCYEAHENSLNREIKAVRLDLQNYQENTSLTLNEIRATNEELRDMNKHILGLISYQEDRLRTVEKKAHTHDTDML